MSAVSAPPGFQFLEPIAQTSTAEVFRAVDLSRGHEAAVKLLKPSFDTEQGRRNFLKGARIQSSLQHPGIIPILQIGEFSEGRPFVVMPLISGETLRQVLRSIPVASSERPQFLSLFEQVCQTIAYVHERGIIHRNIKPRNVLLGTRGEVLMVSWGHASASDQAEPELVGTPLYMPPRTGPVRARRLPIGRVRARRHSLRDSDRQTSSCLRDAERHHEQRCRRKPERRICTPRCVWGATRVDQTLQAMPES